MTETIETKFGKVEFVRVGKGQPIVFLHGGHSDCGETLFQKGYDLNKYELITPSRPGYGQTPVNNNEQPENAARLIKALIAKLSLNHVIVVGISAGGLTAIELAAQLGSAVQKLILISAVTKKWLNQEDDFYRRGKKMFSPRMEKFSWAMFRFFFRLFPKKMTAVLFEEISTKSGYTIEKEEIEEIKEMTFKQRSRQGFVLDLDQDIDEETISQIECATLILHSKNDKSVNIGMAKHAHEKIKNSELHVFDNNWGHLLWVGKEKKKPIETLNIFLNKSD